MFYKGIIFDLDDTLYDYKKCHETGILTVINYIIEHNDKHKNYEYIFEVYNKINNKLKHELKNTASSHNKSIYFKHLIEELNLDYYHFQILHELYWTNFYTNMVCFEGVEDFIIWNKTNDIKIGILTDYETEYQIIKLEKLGLLSYIDNIVTSEEVGIEKPSVNMFSQMLRKMNLSCDEVIMIGDNYEKDIIGALNIGVKSYWFNKNNINCNNFKELHSKFYEIHHTLNELKNISKYCGERFDLVQAGGGNTSVKVDDLMFIKASGYNLTNIDEKNGYVVINNKLLLQDIYSNSIKEVVNYNLLGNKRGSIETFMHSILKKYTIHLHPVQINRVLVSVNSKDIIKQIYPNGLIINYLTPGIKVCNEIMDIYNNENVIFLLNHGIIITCDDINSVYEILGDILYHFESYQKINYDKYKFTNNISKTINSTFNIENISYLCQDEIINRYLKNNTEIFKEKITFPDCLIYCGVKILFGLNNIQEYKELYREYPKIIIENQCVYINSHSLTKCRDIEEVLKSNLLILDSNLQKNYLSNNEICFLNNWDAEKYRKLL
jgi:FMN phosphatase YigB (HAD superfamily)